MLCDICQVNEAVISYTEITNGTKNEKHLCEACAAKYTGLDSRHFAVLPGGLLAALLSNMIMEYDSGMNDKDMKKTNFICPSCKMTYNEFLKYGKLGCHDCYKTFGLILDPCLNQMQGSSQHIGKEPPFQEVFVDIPEFKPMKNDAQDLPEHIDITEDIQDEKALETAGKEKNQETDRQENNREDDIGHLQLMLSQAVAGEEYEEAARLRDLIRDKRAAHGTVEHE
ncbi:MAG: UvrB/UvrC motif-containing protein [Clostridiales bacterium]|nr:UvrB/UvrC motif-containing protein [Clostridiales bacterium]